MVKNLFMPRATYSIYVVELSKTVYSENWRFRQANPQYNGVSECLYVGMTSKSPRERFDQHKQGAKSKKGIKISSYYVEKYGKFLRSSLVPNFGEIKSRKQALELEKQLAEELRRKRHAVWTN